MSVKQGLTVKVLKFNYSAMLCMDQVTIFFQIDYCLVSEVVRKLLGGWDKSMGNTAGVNFLDNGVKNGVKICHTINSQTGNTPFSELNISKRG